MQATPAEKRKLLVLEDSPLSMTLTEFNTEAGELYTQNVINESKVADLGNKRRLAVHAKNNKRSYYKGKGEMQVLADEVEQMIRAKEQLIEERRDLISEIQFYSNNY